MTWWTRVATAVVAGVLAMLAGAGVAAAQEESDGEQSRSQQAYEECVSRQRDEAAARELISQGVVDREEYTGHRNGLLDEATVAEIKEDHPEEFEQLHDHYASNDSVSGRMGRAMDSTACNILRPIDTAVGATQDAVSEFWGDPIGDFVRSLIEGNAQTLQTAMTFWMDYSTTQTVDIDANVQGVKNIVLSVSGVALVASFLIGGWKIASSRRMGLQDGVEETGEVVGKYIIFSTAVPLLVPGAMVASDMLADAIMETFGVTDPETFVELTRLSESMAGPIIILGLAVVSIIGAVIQLLAMVTRVLILPIVTGLMPLAAASSFSQTGRSFLGHTVAFMIAAIAYKPIAALLYAVALWNVTRPAADDDLMAAVINVLMIALVGFCAPALVKAVAPLTAGAGGGGAAPLLGGAASGAAMTMGVAGGVLGALGSRGGGGGGAASSAASAAAPAVGGSGPGSASGGSGGGGGPRGPGGPGGSGGSSGGSGGRSSSSRSGGTGGSGGSARPSGARGGGGGGSGGPAGARGGGGSGSARPSAARRVMSAGSAAAQGVRAGGRGMLRGASAGARLASAGFRGGAAAARTAGAAAHTTQRVFDESIGVTGYAGQVHR